MSRAPVAVATMAPSTLPAKTSSASPRRNFVPPPPSFHSPQPRLLPFTARAAQDATNSPGSSSALSPPRLHKYPPSASQSHKLLTSPTSQASISPIRRRSNSASAKSARSLGRSSTVSSLAATPSGRSPHCSPLSIGRSSVATNGSPVPVRHRRSSSSASASAAVALALTRSLRARLHRTGSDNTGYYDSDESWDDGELDPHSEYALPDWKPVSNSRNEGNSLQNAPLIDESTLRGWTSDVDTAASEGSSFAKPRAIVRKFSSNFAPSATSHGSPKVSPSAPFKLARALNTGPGSSTSTGRGSPVLLASRPAHAKQASSLTLTREFESPSKASDKLLPAFVTPPMRSADLFSLDASGDIEEQLRDELDGFRLSPPMLARKQEPDRQPRPYKEMEPSREKALLKQSSSFTLRKQRSFGSLDTNEATPHSTHQAVHLRTVRKDIKAASPRAHSFADTSSTPKPHSLSSSVIRPDETPKASTTSQPTKTSVSISSIRNALSNATGHSRAQSRQQTDFGSYAGGIPKISVPRTVAAASRPSTPPPFSDLITMPAPTVRQSKAERILGLSAGAAAAIQASAGAVAGTSDVVQSKNPHQLHSTPSLTGAYTAHHYARVRSPYELLPRSVTPSGPALSSVIKQKVQGSDIASRAAPTKATATRPFSRKGTDTDIGAQPKAILSAVPLLSYDPCRRPQAESLASVSTESLEGKFACGSSVITGDKSVQKSKLEGDSPDSLVKVTELSVAAGISLPQALKMNSSALMRKLNPKRTGSGPHQANAMGEEEQTTEYVEGHPRQQPQHNSRGGEALERPDTAWLAPAPTPNHRSPLLAALDAEQGLAQGDIQKLQASETLLPPLPARKPQPRYALPPTPSPNPPPTPIKKDSWLVREITMVSPDAAERPCQAENPSPQLTRPSNPGQHRGIFSSTDSLPFVDDSCRNSVVFHSDARPSSAEIDARFNTLGETHTSGEDTQTDSEMEDLVELPLQNASVAETQVDIKPIPAFSASVLGTRLIAVSDLDDYDLYDVGCGLQSRRRTIVELKVRTQTFWLTKEVLENASPGSEMTRLTALVINTAKMAELMFGPEDGEPSELEPEAEVNIIESSSDSRTPLSDLSELSSPATATTITFEFSLQQPRGKSSTAVSPSSVTLEVDVATPLARERQSFSAAPSDGSDRSGATTRLAGTARTSNTSTFARALGPLVAQQAAYIARLRMQQQEQAHSGGGRPASPPDIGVFDLGGNGTASYASSGDAGRDPTQDHDVGSSTESADRGDASPMARCSASTTASSWLCNQSQTSDLFPTRRPSELIRDGELAAADAAAAATKIEKAITAPPVVRSAQDKHVVVGDALPCIVVDPASAAERPERMHLLITIKLNRDPDLYPSILSKLCSTMRGQETAQGGDGELESTSGSGSGSGSGSESGCAGPEVGDLRASIVLQPVNVGTISRRRRRRGQGNKSHAQGPSSAAQSGTIWTAGAEAEEAAWLGF